MRVELMWQYLTSPVRAVWNTLRYKLTNDMIVSLANYGCKMINMFPKVNSSGVYPLENFLQEYM